MIGAGSVNAWKCNDCGGLTVAVHVDAGVTPMFLGCRRTEGCKGRAVSSMYPDPPLPDHVLDALAWEWYMPGDKELRKLDPATRDHCEQGGLVIRPLTDAGRAALHDHD